MSRPLLDLPPVAGGTDLDLPGAGVRLRATRWLGDGEQPPVLLLHGLASSRRFWDLVVPGLGDLDVATLDQRGHGDSERPSGPYDSGTVVADALSVLDALGWSRAVVVGHSWGASTALRLAASAPDRLDAVVAIDGGLGSVRAAGTDRASARERLTPPRTAMPPDRLRTMVAGGQLAPWWSPQLEAALLPLFGIHNDGLARARLPFEAHMAIVDDLLDAAPPRLADIACPAWLVACDSGLGDDWSLSKLQGLDDAGHALRQPRLHRWTGALHDVPLQWPALVCGLVRAAVDEAAALARAAAPSRAQTQNRTRAAS